MKTHTINSYSFNELSEEAKKKAIENERNTMEVILDFWKNECIDIAKENGFNDIKLSYSLGYSHGDGVNFSCKDFDIDTFLKKHVTKESIRNVLKQYLVIQITGNKGRYCFASKNDVDIYMEGNRRVDYTNIDKLVGTLRQSLEGLYMSLCNEFERIGYADIENQQSDEYISENLEQNEIQFDENGKIFNY